MTLAHPDPALEQAHRAALHAGPKAAADALLAAMVTAGWVDHFDSPALADWLRVAVAVHDISSRAAALAAVDAAYPHIKRALRAPMEDGR